MLLFTRNVCEPKYAIGIQLIQSLIPKHHYQCRPYQIEYTNYSTLYNNLITRSLMKHVISKIVDIHKLAIYITRYDNGAFFIMYLHIHLESHICF